MIAVKADRKGFQKCIGRKKGLRKCMPIPHQGRPCEGGCRKFSGTPYVFFWSSHRKGFPVVLLKPTCRFCGYVLLPSAEKKKKHSYKAHKASGYTKVWDLMGCIWGSWLMSLWGLYFIFEWSWRLWWVPKDWKYKSPTQLQEGQGGGCG